MQFNWDVMSLLFKLKSIKVLFHWILLFPFVDRVYVLTILFKNESFFHSVDLKESFMGDVQQKDISLQSIDIWQRCDPVAPYFTKIRKSFKHEQLLSKLFNNSLMRKQTFFLYVSLHIFVQWKK